MKVVQLPAIANEGRFGNRLIHYLVGKCYAEKVGATVEIPRDWVGETIFEISEPYIEQPAQLLTNLYQQFKGTVALPPFFNMPHRFVDRCLTRESVQRIFKWRPDWIRVKHRCKAAIHVRRGDFLTNPDFPVVQEEDLLSACWLKSSVTIVSEDNPRDSGLFPNELLFLEDFQTLMQAIHVFVYPRSTFSQMAALMGDGNIYMPHNYGTGWTTCNFKRVDTRQPVIFPTKNNHLP